MKDQRAETLVKAFEEAWIYRGHGIPKVILSNHGANVDGETFHWTPIRKEQQLTGLSRMGCRREIFDGQAGHPMPAAR